MATFCHVLNPVYYHIALIACHGRVIYATHQGNVNLYLEIPSCVISITLSNDSYVCDWDMACVISFRKIDNLGSIQMIVGDSSISTM